MRRKSMNILIEAYLLRKRVLFRATEDMCQNVTEAVGHVYEGRVVQVNAAKERAQVTFTYYSTRGTKYTWWMRLENIIAIFDHNQGTQMTIGRHTGKMVDLRTEEQKTADEAHPDL